jgi:hypothetical protein
VSSVRPNGRRAARTRLLEALVIWGWVRSCWTAESLASEAARGSPRARLADLPAAASARSGLPGAGPGRDRLVVRFSDATYLPTRPTGAKEGVLVAWGL